MPGPLQLNHGHIHLKPGPLQLKLGPLHFVLRDDEHTLHLIDAQLKKNLAGYRSRRPMEPSCVLWHRFPLGSHVQWILHTKNLSAYC